MPGAKDNSAPSYMVVLVPVDASFFTTGFSFFAFVMVKTVVTGPAPTAARTVPALRLITGLRSSTCLFVVVLNITNVLPACFTVVFEFVIGMW